MSALTGPKVVRERVREQLERIGLGLDESQPVVVVADDPLGGYLVGAELEPGRRDVRRGR